MTTPAEITRRCSAELVDLAAALAPKSRARVLGIATVLGDVANDLDRALRVGEAVANRVEARSAALPVLPDLPQRIAIRRAAGLTQQDMAEIVGVNRSAVAHWEAGRAEPTGPKLHSYAQALAAMQRLPA